MNTRFRNENSIRKELVLAVEAMKKSNDFDTDKFYSILEKLINNIKDEECNKLLHGLVMMNPAHEFGILYYLFRSYYNNIEYVEEFKYLKNFIDYKIDIFMLYNFIK